MKNIDGMEKGDEQSLDKDFIRKIIEFNLNGPTIFGTWDLIFSFPRFLRACGKLDYVAFDVERGFDRYVDFDDVLIPLTHALFPASWRELFS